MPNWSNQIPKDPRGHGLPLVRTPTNGTLVAIITSTDLVGCDTHFWGGHTVACTAPDCEACGAGISYRWHAYFSIYNPKTQLHAILELTAQAAHYLAEYRKTHGTLRNCQIEAYRWKHTRNGRVIIKCNPSSYAPLALPNPPDLTRVMAIIWRLPIDNLIVAGEQRCNPALHIAAGGDGQSSDPREYTTPQP